MNKKVLEIEELVKVDSSNIDMVGYSGDTTYVQFKNGGIYCYPKTQRQEFEALSKAQSVGSHFAKTYRNKDQYAKLDNTELKVQEKDAIVDLGKLLHGQVVLRDVMGKHITLVNSWNMDKEEAILLVGCHADQIAVIGNGEVAKIKAHLPGCKLYWKEDNKEVTREEVLADKRLDEDLNDKEV